MGRGRGMPDDPETEQENPAEQGADVARDDQPAGDEDKNP